MTADGSFVVAPAVVSSPVTPRAAGRRVVRSSWSRGPVATSLEAAALGCSVDEAEEPVHSESSRAAVEPTVEAEATAEEGAVCVRGGPSEEAGVVPCASASAVSSSVTPTADETNMFQPRAFHPQPSTSGRHLLGLRLPVRRSGTGWRGTHLHPGSVPEGRLWRSPC